MDDQMAQSKRRLDAIGRQARPGRIFDTAGAAAAASADGGEAGRGQGGGLAGKVRQRRV